MNGVLTINSLLRTTPRILLCSMFDIRPSPRNCPDASAVLPQPAILPVTRQRTRSLWTLDSVTVDCVVVVSFCGRVHATAADLVGELVTALSVQDFVKILFNTLAVNNWHEFNSLFVNDFTWTMTDK